MGHQQITEAGEHQQLARCIYFWLNYHSTVSKSDTLLESAVRFPLVEYIERRCGEQVKLEVGHPDFDRLRIDFSYAVSGITRNIELKYLHDYSDRDDEFKRFFDDLVRLAILEGSINYFILCGSWDLYHKKILKDLRPVTKGHIPNDSQERPIYDNKFKDILPLNEIGEEISFEPNAFFGYVGGKKNDVKPERQIPIRINAINVKMVAKADDMTNGSQVVYIWRVKSVKSYL